jgi:hypothetical protein
MPSAARMVCGQAGGQQLFIDTDRQGQEIAECRELGCNCFSKLRGVQAAGRGGDWSAVADSAAGGLG